MIMLRFGVVLFCFVCLTYATKKEDDHCCGKGEQWYECATCDVDCYGQPEVCTDECKVGCYCKDGYVRDKNYVCIRKECCPNYHDY